MPNNPIVYNTGGLFRFTDYVSQLPEFIREEEDVILMLQLFSDYINNAYRTLSNVTLFSFKLVATDATVIETKNKLNKLSNLFKAAESRGEPILFLSKPQGNPHAGAMDSFAIPADAPIFKQYINYPGTIEDLGPSIITIPLISGDKVYVNFTNPEQFINSAVYVYVNQTTLIVDPNNSSQDPFNQSSNEPFQTTAGLTPRMLQFNASNISNVGARRFSYSNGINYYEVYFTATIDSIKNIPSTISIETDIKYLVDYYDVVSTVPSSYSEHYSVGFADGCPNFDWRYNVDNGLRSIPGNSLFYTRSLTQIPSRTSTGNNIQTPTKYVDPIYTPNTFQINIREILNDGLYLTIYTTQPHKSNTGDNVKITNSPFAGSYTVVSVLNDISFTVEYGATPIISSLGGELIIRNLYYSNYINDVNSSFLILPYINLVADNEVPANVVINRVDDEFTTEIRTFKGDISAVNIISDTITLSEPLLWENATPVTVKATLGSVLPGGLSENVVYALLVVDAVNNVVKFRDVNLGTVGNGTLEIIKTTRYFDAATDVNVSGNCITLNNVDGLSIDSYVVFYDNMGTCVLPTPLVFGRPYRIKTIDFISNTVSFDGIDINAIGSGLINTQLQIVDATDGGISLITRPNIPLQSGSIVLKTFHGDLISKGKFVAINKNSFIAYGKIDSEAVLWNNKTNNLYYKGTFVVYPDNISGVDVYTRYLVTNTDNVTAKSYPPNKQMAKKSHYVTSMEQLIYREQILDINPYMFGMYDTVPLGFNEDINASSGYGVLGSKLFIQKEQELTLKYGMEQKNWLFSPRFAPEDILVRNGWIDITSTEKPFDPVIAGVSLFVNANAIQNITLFGELSLYNTVVNFIVSGVNATITTIAAHGYRTGITITISGADQSIVNKDYVVTVTGESSYTIVVPSGTPSIITGDVQSSYYAKNGDYIRTVSQSDVEQNGIYVVNYEYWTLYNRDTIANNTIIFTPYNLFDINNVNPEIAKSNTLFATSGTPVGPNTVQLKFNQPHNMVVGNIITVSDAYPDYYNGRFTVVSTPNLFTIQYKIIQQATPLQNANGTLVVESWGWYKYMLNDISWQQKTLPMFSYQLSDSNCIYNLLKYNTNEFANNVYVLAGLYSLNAYKITSYCNNNIDTVVTPNLTRVMLRAGDIIELSDQSIYDENGVWRVSEGSWQKLKSTVDNPIILDKTPVVLETPTNRRLVMKVGKMTIDAYENEEPTPLQLSNSDITTFVYSTYNATEVANFINTNATSSQQVYIVDYPFIKDSQFKFESIDNIDTIGAIQNQYNANFDYNTVVNPTTMKPDWNGIPTMKYPLSEKIGRLIYQKDPNVIDFEVIGYLGRYLGYDITTILEDLVDNPYYKNEAEVQMALRKLIENLPEFNALKSTNAGLDSLLLAFGIIGKIVTMWTDVNDPYGEFIPDYQIHNTNTTNLASGDNVTYVPTPHFKIIADMEGPGFNQFLADDARRIITSIKTYKPINTVFDGIIKYLKAKATASVRMGTMRSVGSVQFSVGYGDDLDFTNITQNNFNNDCI